MSDPLKVGNPFPNYSIQEQGAAASPAEKPSKSIPTPTLDLGNATPSLESHAVRHISLDPPTAQESKFLSIYHYHAHDNKFIQTSIDNLKNLEPEFLRNVIAVREDGVCEAVSEHIAHLFSKNPPPKILNKQGEEIKNIKVNIVSEEKFKAAIINFVTRYQNAQAGAATNKKSEHDEIDFHAKNPLSNREIARRPSSPSKYGQPVHIIDQGPRLVRDVLETIQVIAEAQKQRKEKAEKEEQKEIIDNVIAQDLHKHEIFNGNLKKAIEEQPFKT